MNSTEIKKFLKSILPADARLSVTTNPTQNPYICARIRPNPSKSVMDPLVYAADLPVTLRQCALAAVYGADSSVAKQTAGGNIGAHSIAMKAHEWRLAVSLFSKC